MTMKRTYNTIDEALDALRQGRIIIATDDPDRENEGDFICAAQYCTTENMNFMATHGKGLICLPISSAFAEKLALITMRTGKRAYMAYTREEAMTVSSPRHEADVHVRLGASRDGIIQVISVESLWNGGASTGK